MRIVNTMCISKEKAVRHYVNLIFKVFEETSEITQRKGGGVVECQLKKSKSGVWLGQNWMFVECDFFFVFLCLFTLCSFIVFFIVLHVKQKR